MKALLASLLIVTTAASAHPPRSNSDAREILRVVFAFEASVHRQGSDKPPPCVVRRIGRPSLGGSRWVVDTSQLPLVPRPAGSRLLPVASEIGLSPFAVWKTPAAVNPGYVEDSGPLAAELEAPIRAAERIAVAAPPQRPTVSRVDPSWIGPPLEFCAGAERWPHLRIESPAIVGDFAFVRAEFNCVLCGQGVLFALRRSGAGWEIVANAQIWVS